MVDDLGPDAVLAEVLKIYSSRLSSHKAQAMTSHLVTTDFDPISLIISPHSTSFTATKAHVKNDNATAIVLDNRDHPFIAVLKRIDDRWLLKIVAYKCPSCLGNGILFGDQICFTCGGTGWGEDLTFC